MEKISIGVTGHASRNRHELREKKPCVHAQATFMTKTRKNVDQRDGSRITQQTQIARKKISMHARATYMTETQRNIDRRDGSSITQQTRIV